ncbi:MAG TPA: thiamine-phosphate kinase [Burkholderiaceae bacterium]|nr:thiamine-phosphate kinase [Burkholderiaceae bacterium]
MSSEFDLIARFFSRPAPPGFLGVGDDCALLPLEPGMRLATSTDLLLEGRHFLPGTDPGNLGHKALAVNLSDLAAMGAKPLACVLGLSVPKVDEPWLRAFSEGFHSLADEAGCPLVGGDTTRSPWGVVISVTVYGQVDPARALRRDAARVGDDIWISGTLGAADIALRLLQGKLPLDPGRLAALRPALERPQPPLRLAQALAGVAHAALDISDGLAQDLGHILEASHCGAELDLAALPIDPGLDGLDSGLRRQAALDGGDVYQLCFTAPSDKRDIIARLALAASTRVTRVGRIVEHAGLAVQSADGGLAPYHSAGFDHFSS